jgi:hypothetical protein
MLDYTEFGQRLELLVPADLHSRRASETRVESEHMIDDSGGPTDIFDAETHDPGLTLGCPMVSNRHAGGNWQRSDPVGARHRPIGQWECAVMVALGTQFVDGAPSRRLTVPRPAVTASQSAWLIVSLML